jgi:hypothetical protein
MSSNTSTTSVTVSQSALRDKFLELGCSMWEEGERQHIYRKKGFRIFVTLPKKDRIRAAFVIGELKKLGLTREQADAFVTESQSQVNFRPL